MKRIFLGVVTAVIALGLVGSAFAAPSMVGSKGLFRVIDASNHGPMSFTIGTYGMYWSKSKTYTGAGTNKITYISLEPGLSFAPIKFLEFSASVPYVLQGKSKFTPTTGTVTEHNDTGLLDAEVGLKFSYQFSPMFTAGLRAAAMVPTMGDSFKSWTTHGGTRVEAVKNNVDVGGLALFSFNFMDKAKLHINGGALYTMDEVDTAASTAAAAAYKKYDSPLTVNFGGGLEISAMPYVTPILEVTSSYPMLGDKASDSTRYIRKPGTTVSEKPGPMTNLLFTGGLRFNHAFSGVHNLTLTAGADLPIGSDLLIYGDTAKAQYYDYQIIGGLTYAYIPPVGPKVPGTGSIAGTVTDLDGNPVSGADVAFTGTSVAPVTSGADGKFAATGLPVGMITVSVSKDGFVTKDETPTIAKKKVVDLAVKLEKKPVPKATLAGKVSDTEGKAVANATVKAEGSTATTDVSGSYTMDVVVAQTGGTYNVDVTAPGYKDKSGTVALTPGQPAAKDFTLLSTTLKMKMVINFKTGSATIVGSSADIDKVAGILKDNPNVKVEIAGYTDNRGSSKKNMKLSQARADAAKSALIAAGVSADRISSKGYGASEPVASNSTRLGRLQNRRIELHVL
jgi:outer membrane protein OmpA-like peptidoglycan-associated protein